MSEVVSVFPGDWWTDWDAAWPNYRTLSDRSARRWLRAMRRHVNRYPTGWYR